MMETEDIELQLLIEAIRQRYGHDLSSYAFPSLKRRLHQALAQLGLKKISELIPYVLHDSYHYTRLLNTLSITITEMFRDPEVFQSIKQQILPQLRTNPYNKFWIAGCATGEEAYSLAILLHEENLLDNSIIFATDINLNAINKAREGIYDKSLIKSCENSYQRCGGRNSLLDYFIVSRFANIKVKKEFKDKIIFAQHDLTKEKEFSEVHMVMCRNVLMYFNQIAQQKIINMFKSSLYRNGYLCIGKRESLRLSEDLIQVNSECKLFQHIKLDTKVPLEFSQTFDSLV